MDEVGSSGDNMGEIPQYYLPVTLLPGLKDHFSAAQLQLVCTEEWCLKRYHTTYCAEWEIQSEGQEVYISASVVYLKYAA